jgi:hypothetical protein
MKTVLLAALLIGTATAAFAVPGLVRSQHHRLMIASTIVSIIQQQTRLTLGLGQNSKANPRLDASLLQ